MILLVAAGALSWSHAAGRLPFGIWLEALWRGDTADTAQMLFAYSFLPRLVVSLLCGASLGLAGALCQLSLRNPIASPTTLGIEAGASLALSVAMLWAPWLFAFGRVWPALAGGSLAATAVLALSWRQGLAPISVVLAGLVTGLFCAALTAMLTLFKTEYLAGLFIWGSGSLSQQGWTVAAKLAPVLVAAALTAVLLVRPLTLLTVDDAKARSLGLSVATARLCALALAVGLSVNVVSAVGVIGFVSLAAPVLARSLGARRAGHQLVWSTTMGAGLLWLVDQGVQTADALSGLSLPTGAVTALLGAPLLIVLLVRQRSVPLVPPPPFVEKAPLAPAISNRLIGLMILLVIVLVLSTTVGRDGGGWHLSLGHEFDRLVPLRLPRAIAALAAGTMLGLAGCLLQRLTGNPMAGPEVLGVSAGAAFGLAVALFSLSTVGQGAQMLAASIGAFIALAAILALDRKASPDRALIVGIAFGAMFDAMINVLMAGGDPRAMLLLNWMMGSTYSVDATAALVSIGAASVLFGGLLLTVRMLTILPLGRGMSLALGLNPTHSHVLTLGLSALLAAMATLIVGPLSFVGLMAPHLARRLGMRQALAELAGAAIIGGLVMVAADWFGRTIAFPRQIPAGLAASLIGGPSLIWLLSRRSPS
ncbi:Fe(3+)-hydroxamate ABC transporter permease FhuB [Labrys sp. KB_33_2]|uniref:Fe(3+)-hydroxamate ABC transporter permease FhuB n=1 Tax=Labrys sp. KB_33_2 TaxID=3237479 RepID=UPI003F8F1B18